LDTDSGHKIPLYLWQTSDEPLAVIQVFHGLGEHIARYERFAAAANARGFAVCGHNHRGHGPASQPAGFFAPRDGWRLLVDDGHRVTDFLRRRFAGKPVVLLGHSMGSYIAQSYAMRFGDDLAALVLSGSTWPSRGLLFAGRILALIEKWRLGMHGSSPLLDKIGFGDFNKRFEPARTELDWLSRDADEVDKYIADPLCGGPYTTGLWRDLLGGLGEVGNTKALGRVPAGLPVLITGGADDPVGGAKGMLELADAYQRSGHQKVDKAIFADGRHEMLNETNREEFTKDLLDWVERQLSGYQA
ncbi:MAG: alpha/beta hydrolase, partial [Gammaproteobacteria bacterium]|nr:alpha/beta hydrolase [Gammaproteobacteria bacterium]NNL51345.1 alpha/beta hydrolase [Woeseiaceae bacterium]